MYASDLPDSVQLFDELAQQYKDKYQDVSAYHDTLQVFLDQLPADAKVLDLACGPGNVTRFLLDRRPDAQVHGADLSPNMLEIARGICPEASFSALNLKDVSLLEGSYDGICCAFGLPYLSREEALAFIRDCKSRLNPDGLIYLSTMEDDYTRSGPHTSAASDRVLHLYYHERAYLINALEDSGMRVIRVKDQPNSPDETETSRDLVLVAVVNHT